MPRKGIKSKTTFASKVHKSMRQELRRRDFGKVFRPLKTPPEYSQAPWNSISIRSRLKTDSSVNYGILAANLWNRLGISSTNDTWKAYHFSFRIISASAWELSGNSIMMIIHDIVDPGSHEELCSLEDQPGRNQWASVGYEWPVSHQIITRHSDDDKNTIILWVGTNSGTSATETILLNMNILWRGTQRVVPTSMKALESSIEELSF